MRAIFATVLLSLTSIVAQAAPEAADTFVVRGADRSATPMAAWEEDGNIRTVGGDAVGQAREGAVTYEAKLVEWPTATVKVLTFAKENGGVLHPITDETLIYVLEGKVQASVAGKGVALSAGDVASLPDGALRNSSSPADAVVVAWTAATQFAPRAKKVGSSNP